MSHWQKGHCGKQKVEPLIYPDPALGRFNHPQAAIYWFNVATRATTKMPK